VLYILFQIVLRWHCRHCRHGHSDNLLHCGLFLLLPFVGTVLMLPILISSERTRFTFWRSSGRSTMCFRHAAVVARASRRAFHCETNRGLNRTGGRPCTTSSFSSSNKNEDEDEGILIPCVSSARRYGWMTVKNFSAFHQRFRQRRMRMNRQGDVLGGRAHLQCKSRLGNQLAGIHAADATPSTRSLSGSMIIFVKPSVRSKLSARPEAATEFNDFVFNAFFLCFSLGQPTPGSSGSVKTTAE